MNSIDFVALATANTDKTSNIRSSETLANNSSVQRIPDEISGKFGSIVALVQAQIENGLFCSKDEYLLIYSFQPLQVLENAYYCSLDMVIKPVSEMDKTEVIDGRPLQLVVNGTSGDIMNNSMALVELGIISEEEALEEEEAPLSFGNYKQYLALTDAQSNQGRLNLTPRTELAMEVQQMLIEELLDLQETLQKGLTIEQVTKDLDPPVLLNVKYSSLQVNKLDNQNLNIIADDFISIGSEKNNDKMLFSLFKSKHLSSEQDRFTDSTFNLSPHEKFFERFKSSVYCLK